MANTKPGGGMTNSRRKGANGEREAAKAIAAALGAKASRMGRNGRTAEDIDHDIPGVWVEVKRPARLGWWKYMTQSKRDAGDKVPTVLMRPNDDTDWMLAMPLNRVREFVRRVNEMENAD